MYASMGLQGTSEAQDCMLGHFEETQSTGLKEGLTVKVWNGGIGKPSDWNKTL